MHLSVQFIIIITATFVLEYFGGKYITINFGMFWG